MRRSFRWTVIPALCLGLSAAHGQLDSLLGVLGALPRDTSRLPVLTGLLRATVFNDPDSALVFAAEYRTIAKKSGIAMEMGKGHNFTGMCYSVKGASDQALKHYLAALPHFEQGTDPWYTAMAHNNIGSIYETELRYGKALAEYRQALDMFIEQRDTTWIANVSNNMANVHFEQGDLDSAMTSYERADRLLTQAGMSAFASQIRMNLANVHTLQGDVARALEVMRSAWSALPEDVALVQRADMLIKLGHIQGLNGIRDSAMRNMRDGTAMAREAGAMKEAIDGHASMSAFFETIGRADSALVHHKIMAGLRDSLITAERSAQIAEMQVKYETGKKDVLLAENQAKLERRDLLIKATATSAILLLLAGLFAYRAYSLKKRTSDALQAKNAVIDAQLKEKELLVREIHHRVKNNLQVVSSLLSLQSRGITDAKAREAVQESRDRVKSMALIHQDLYREDDLTGIRMREYVEKLARSLLSSHRMTDAGIELTIDVDDLDLDVDTAVPLGLILNELITNALKYAFHAEGTGHLTIRLKEQDDRLLLSVRDNGAGYDPDAERGEESSGFGLNMVRTFSQKLQAEWGIRNEDGTVVELRIANFKKAG